MRRRCVIISHVNTCRIYHATSGASSQIYWGSAELLDWNPLSNRIHRGSGTLHTMYTVAHAIISHTRTVVRECCKGDNASQWRNPKFDPPPRSNPISDSHKSWQRWLRRGPLHLCKSSSQSAQAYRFCACVTLRTKNVLVFLGGFLQLARAKGTERILTHNTPKHAVPPKDVPFRGREHKI